MSLLTIYSEVTGDIVKRTASHSDIALRLVIVINLSDTSINFRHIRELSLLWPNIWSSTVNGRYEAHTILHMSIGGSSLLKNHELPKFWGLLFNLNSNAECVVHAVNISILIHSSPDNFLSLCHGKKMYHTYDMMFRRKKCLMTTLSVGSRELNYLTTKVPQYCYIMLLGLGVDRACTLGLVRPYVH